MEYKLAQGNCGLKVCGCKKNSQQMLSVYDWLADIPETQQNRNFVEVQFKNTRKGYFLNSNNLKLEKGDIVAAKYAQLNRFVFGHCKSTLQAPFMTLSFMSLLVIPSLKIGDQGLFDVDQFCFVDMID